MDVRTRFAPSPTGLFHVGNARTALYCWLFARQHQGKFLLRIEDTDAQRSHSDFFWSIVHGMRWLRLDWDEGPYFQTRRTARYNDVIDRMLREKTAYRCFCSTARLTALRNAQVQQGQTPRYDARCRGTNSADSERPHAVRFKNPTTGFVVVRDQLRGRIRFDNRQLNDFVIRRSNGVPTYNLCVVVDDHDMRITHVIRGSDHIDNTPKQVNLLKALHASIPCYAHLPLVLDDNKKRISKRNNAVDVLRFKRDGYLPEAVLNHLLRLGWSHKDQEIFSVSEMQKLFRLSEVHASPSAFDRHKLRWLNRHYIRRLPPETVALHLSACLKDQNVDTRRGPSLVDTVNVFKERCSTLQEMAQQSRFLYRRTTKIDRRIRNAFFDTESFRVLRALKASIRNTPWNAHDIRNRVCGAAREWKTTRQALQMLLRVVLTGRTHSPDVCSIMRLMGKSSCVERIDAALQSITFQQ